MQYPANQPVLWQQYPKVYVADLAPWQPPAHISFGWSVNLHLHYIRYDWAQIGVVHDRCRLSIQWYGTLHLCNMIYLYMVGQDYIWHLYILKFQDNTLISVLNVIVAEVSVSLHSELMLEAEQQMFALWPRSFTALTMAGRATVTIYVSLGN